MRDKLRVVIDTNVLLRIILSRKPQGVAAAIWSLFASGRFQLVTSEPLLKELSDTLIVPELSEVHMWTQEQVQNYVESLREIAVVTPGISGVALPELSKRDSSDLAFVVAAVEGNASYIVTQDRDLLDIVEFMGISLIDPLDFLKILRSLL
jgi:putative PIN family toxin of toxin-antitoxin system